MDVVSRRQFLASSAIGLTGTATIASGAGGLAAEPAPRAIRIPPTSRSGASSERTQRGATRAPEPAYADKRSQDGEAQAASE
jgi:hypothetical protein